MTVTGRPELVDEAIDHLLNLEEEYVSFPLQIMSKTKSALCALIGTYTVCFVSDGRCCGK